MKRGLHQPVFCTVHTCTVSSALAAFSYCIVKTFDFLILAHVFSVLDIHLLIQSIYCRLRGYLVRPWGWWMIESMLISYMITSDCCSQVIQEQRSESHVKSALLRETAPLQLFQRFIHLPSLLLGKSTDMRISYIPNYSITFSHLGFFPPMFCSLLVCPYDYFNIC